MAWDKAMDGLMHANAFFGTRGSRFFVSDLGFRLEG